jgi:hypothetical protein
MLVHNPFEAIHKETFSGVIDARAHIEADKQIFLRYSDEYKKMMAEEETLLSAHRTSLAKIQALSAPSDRPASNTDNAANMTGMVAAFNLSAASGSCPTGWRLFERGSSRCPRYVNM